MVSLWTPANTSPWGSIDTPWGNPGVTIWGESDRRDEPEIISADQANFGGFVGNTAVMLMGRRGNGKTLAQTMLADQDIRRFQQTGYPGHIFTNYNMTFLRGITDTGDLMPIVDAEGDGIDVKPFDMYDTYIVERVAEFPSWFRQGSFRGDEVQTMALGRRSMAKANVNLSQFLVQMRHREIDASFTTQFPQIIDYQVLLQIDLFIKVHIVKRRREWPHFPQIMKAEIWDWWGQITGKDYRKPWPPAREDIDRVAFIHVPQRLMGTYSTKQIIGSVYWDHEVRDRVNIEEEMTLGGNAIWLKEQDYEVLERDDAERDELLAQEVAKAQTANAQDPTLRFPEGLIGWARKQTASFTIDNRKLELARNHDPSLKNEAALAEVFESLGYTIVPSKAGGHHYLKAVKS